MATKKVARNGAAVDERPSETRVKVEIETPSAINDSFEQTMTEVRCTLAELWFQARDQASETPVLSRQPTREHIDAAVSALSMQLNSLEDRFNDVADRLRGLQRSSAGAAE
jgi:hypothetical protein